MHNTVHITFAVSKKTYLPTPLCFSVLLIENRPTDCSAPVCVHLKEKVSGLSNSQIVLISLNVPMCIDSSFFLDTHDHFVISIYVKIYVNSVYFNTLKYIFFNCMVCNYTWGQTYLLTACIDWVSCFILQHHSFLLSLLLTLHSYELTDFLKTMHSL